MAPVERLQFKGWTLPGPLPSDSPAALRLRESVPEDQSLDSLSGHFKLFQYKKGHRFSTDDLLVAGYGTQWAPSTSRVLDLGSGIGTVASIAAWRFPQAQLVTIEAQEISVALARKSAVINGIDHRMDIRLGDFREMRSDERFDLVLGSPPYFPLTDGVVAENPQKVACRFETRGHVGDYCLAASRHLTPGGQLSLVFPVQPAHQIERVWQGAKEAGLFVLRYRPVVLKEGELPLLGLFMLARRSDFPPSVHEVDGAYWTDPPLIIRQKEGRVHPEYVAFKAMIGFPP